MVKRMEPVKFNVVIVRNETEAVDEVCAALQSGVVALIDISTPHLSPPLKSACYLLGVAYISVVDNSYFYQLRISNGSNVMIEPASTQMLMVVADIVMREQLNNVAILHDETFDINNTPRRVLTNVPAQHIYIPLSRDVNETNQHIDSIIRLGIKVVFIIADRFNAQNFLTVDAKLNCPSCDGTVRLLLVTARQNTEAQKQFIDFIQQAGILHDFDMDSIKVDEALAFDLATIVTIAINDLAREAGAVFNIANLDCYNLSSGDMNRAQSHQLINLIKQSSRSGVFGPISYSSMDDLVRYELTLLISEVVFEQGTQKSKVQVANWTKAGHIQSTEASLIRADKRRKYRVVTVAGIPPFVYKNEIKNDTGNPHQNGNSQYRGYCIDLLEKIAESMNFDYDIYDTDDVGSMDEQGRWSGAIKELMDGRADIAVGPISVMAERETVIDFTVPYYDLVGLTILMRNPKVDYSLVKFLSVLDEEVWGCIIGAFLLFSVLICLFDRLSPFSYQNRRSQWNEVGEEPRIFTLKEGIWFCMMSLTPQGGGETPRALSGRLVAATWWLFGFIIIATYTANLAAFLTVSRLETPIESLDDLSKQTKVQYAPLNGSTAMTYFKRMADIEQRFYEIWKNMSLNDNLAAVDRAQLAVWDYPVSDKYTKLWDAMNKYGFPQSNEAAISRVLGEDFAFISDATFNKYQMFINCDLLEVGEEFSRKPYALAVQNGSPLLGELSNAILKLINNRTLEELKTKWWKMDKKDCPKVEDESDGISIKNIGGVFLVIVIGSALSLVTLALECYWYR
ncbi:ionotropic receptor 25a-like [Physella acuta]|uniref:ionotropic receptor 25a-like n=1 Tax=Physella acuta TaxID=109671 RepID=UPI0027DB1524|nr:ionotropic receptor 25a-like [Physella acuta]